MTAKKKTPSPRALGRASKGATRTSRKRKVNITLSEVPMRVAGIDLHKRSLTVCVIDKSTGETFTRRFYCSEQAAILSFFKDLKPFQAVVEASATYEWLWELLEPVAERLVLAHPKKLRVIAESMKKSDRSDARFLAWLLGQDAVPEAHRPTPRQREYQLLVKHRHHLVRTRSRIRTQIRSILAARNLDYQPLFSRKGREYLQSLTLRPAERFRIESLMSLLEAIALEIDSALRELSRFREAAPEEEKKNHAILSSIPGVGPLIGDVVISSLGDPGRFRSIHRVTSYSGLVPGYRQSDKTTHMLHITKEGPRILRWALVQAAWGAIRRSQHWRSVFEGIARRRGRKIAVIAVARRLLGVMLALLKNGTKYVESLAMARGGQLRAQQRARPGVMKFKTTTA